MGFAGFTNGPASISPVNLPSNTAPRFNFNPGTRDVSDFGDRGGFGNANAGLAGSAGTGLSKGIADAVVGALMGFGPLGVLGSLLGTVGQNAASQTQPNTPHSLLGFALDALTGGTLSGGSSTLGPGGELGANPSGTPGLGTGDAPGGAPGGVTGGSLGPGGDVGANPGNDGGQAPGSGQGNAPGGAPGGVSGGGGSGLGSGADPGVGLGAGAGQGAGGFGAEGGVGQYAGGGIVGGGIPFNPFVDNRLAHIRSGEAILPTGLTNMLGRGNIMNLINRYRSQAFNPVGRAAMLSNPGVNQILGR